MEESAEILIKCRGGGSIVKKAGVFSPNGLCLYIPWRNVVRSFNVLTGERITDYEGCDGNIFATCINPYNTKIMMACSEQGEIFSWKLKTELLISKKKLDVSIDEIHHFSLVACRNLLNSESDDNGDILLSWSQAQVYYVGLFNSSDCRLQMKLPLKIKTDKHQVAIGGIVNDCFIAVTESNRLQWLFLNRPEKVHRTKIGNGRKFTCVACHPELFCIATGDSTGRIVVWNNITSGNSPAQAIYHWHTLPVRSVVFSHSGSFFYSGAGECVVVKWILDNPHEKNFLPRLAAPIEHLAISPENLYLAISTIENGIRIVDSHYKLKSVIQHLVWGAPFKAGLHYDSRKKSLIMNGHSGHLQFYSPNNMSLLYNLDIVSQNRITQERNLDIPNTDVTKLSLNRGGDWLATVEERYDDGKLQEGRLKFWQFDTTNQMFILNTSIELPHENGINAIEFQPIPNPAELMCVSIGNDRSFKVWSLQDTSTIYKQSRNWCCQFIGHYRGLPTNALSFSMDGSVLAVAFDNCLTLWTSESCELKSSLLHPNYKLPLRIVQFGNANQCHLIVTASSEQLCVWNLLTLGLVWTVPVKLSMLCTDPCSTYMAAITENNTLFVFQPSCMSVEFSKSDICKRNEKILAAAFVPQATVRGIGLKWQENSKLYFIDSKQELLCLETKSEQRNDIPMEFTSQIENSIFSAMLAKNIRSDIKKMDSVRHVGTGLSGAMSIKELIDPPAHTMAPMRLLCGSVLRSFICTDESATQENTKQNLDDFTSESDRYTENESSCESDEDQGLRRRRQIKPEATEDADETVDMKDLESVLNESTEWTVLLI